MATIQMSGPYYYDTTLYVGGQGLLPGNVVNFWAGSFDDVNGDVVVTGTPDTTQPGGTVQARTALWVQDMSVENVPTVNGDIVLHEFYVWATYRNSSANSIRYFTAWIAFITP
ncbi:hypothetical protein ACFRAR_16700 [Kitasatospora sp. NPDC056651]|uniref:hypothetical protein n=1 Tax=Kitasatospora sp. NPDC056651 TaxID=3345892 RepID=UPI00369747CA